MAFCGNCGTQLNEGAKFCPKCGQTVGTGSSAQQQVNQLQQQYVKQEEEKKSFTYRMWHSKWNWIAAAVLLVLFIGVKMGGSTNSIEKTTKELLVEEFKKNGSKLVVKDLNLVHKSGNDYTGFADCTVDGESARYALKVVSDGKKVLAEWELYSVGDDDAVEESAEAEEEYEFDENDLATAGYEAGYEMGFDMADLDFMEPDAKQSFSLYYGAPSTAEEKEMFRIYKENYERGFREGRKAGKE